MTSSMLRQILSWLLYSTAILPLVVFKGLAHPFETPRAVVFRVLLACIVPFACLLWLREPAGRPQVRFLGWSLLAVMGTATLSTIFSIDPGTSFWGFAERLTGLITIGLCILFGATLHLLFRDPRARFRFLCAWFGAWGIVAAWAVVEFFAPGYWSQFHGGEQRVVSTIGNPIFLAGGLTLVTASAATAILAAKTLRFRILFASMALLLGGAGIFFTQTRGAYLGLVGGVLVFGLCLGLWGATRCTRTIGYALPALACLGVLGLFVLRDTPVVRYFSPLNRAVSLFSYSTTDASQVQRFQLWRIALSATAARPLTGWGLENFDTALDRLYDPALTRFGVANAVSDRAHNAYLDVAAATGIPGLLAYCAFLVALAILIVRAKKKGALPPAAAALACGGLAAYAVGNLTAFDTHTTYFGLAVAAALLASLQSDVVAQQKKTVLLDQFPAWAVVFATTAFSIALILFGVVPLVRGSALVHEAIFARNSQQLLAPAQTLLTFWNPYRPHEAQRIANEIFKAVGNSTSRGQAAEELTSAAEALMRDAVQRRPENFSVRFTLANILTLQATRGFRDPADAAAALENARVLAPNRQITDFQLGNLLLIQGNVAAAVDVFERALALDPSIVESHWHLGRGLVASGESTAGAKEFQIALEGGFGEHRPGQEYSVAINALLGEQDLLSVYRLYTYWSEAEPDNPNVFASLAVAAAEIGKRDAAIAALRQAVLLDSTIRAEAPAFLETYHLPADVLGAQE